MPQSKRKKHCGFCKAAGHSIRTCPKAAEVYGKDARKERRSK